MEKSLEDLSASTLRNLLIEEVKKFIVCLDDGFTAELADMKLRLRKIYDLIQVKESQEQVPLVWGKNSTKAELPFPQNAYLNAEKVALSPGDSPDAP